MGQTGDKLRNKVQQLIYKALKGEQDLTREELARDIEAAILELYNGNTNAAYKAKFRTLVGNMKDPTNVELHENLANKLITPYELVRKSEEEIASSEGKKIADAAWKFQIEALQRRKANLATTDQFKCGKCQQRKCVYYQKQTRSADEPMTVFITCTNCDHEWRE